MHWSWLWRSSSSANRYRERCWALKQLGLDLGLFLSQIVNFGLLLGILYVLLYKPILSKLEERAKKIKKGIDDAEQAEQLRADAGKFYQQEIERARREAHEIIERATLSAEQQRAEILSQARQEAHEMILRAQQQVQREIQEGQTQLSQQVVDLAIAAASRVVQENLDDDKHRRLIQEFLSEARQIE